MQYAKIAVKTKTAKIDQLFTYSIPPEILPFVTKGILVDVNFGKNKTQGVIFEITKTIEAKYRSKIKPLVKIIDKNPVLNSEQLDLAKWISAYYLCPIGEAVFAILPPIAHRQIIKNKLNLKNNLKKFNGSIYSLYDREINRLELYLKLTKKSFLANRQSIIVLPDLASKKEIINAFKNEFGEENVAVINSKDSLTQRYKNWQDSQLGKKKIVIGTRWSLFCFNQNLGLIIVDNPYDYGHKEDQAPRYTSLSIAKKIQELTNCNLVLGSAAKNINEIVEKHKVISDNFSKNSQHTKIKLIDKSNSTGFLSWEAENQIKENLDKNKKVLILANHKGEGSLLACADCGHEFVCPNCNINLTPFKKENKLILKCSKCDKIFNIPSKCPNCQSVNLSPRGYALGYIQKRIQKLFPKAKISLLEKDDELNYKEIIAKSSIVIATKKILDFELSSFELSVILNIDSFLNFPDYTVYENILSTVVKLINITRDNLLIQIAKTDDKFINMLGNFNLDNILKFILISRKENYYPPYGKLIKMVYRNSNEKKCQKETAKMIAKIQELNLKNIEILGPIPCYINKKRNKFYWQIVIKILANPIGTKLKLKNIAFTSDWSIDAEPLDLL